MQRKTIKRAIRATTIAAIAAVTALVASSPALGSRAEVAWTAADQAYATQSWQPWWPDEGPVAARLILQFTADSAQARAGGVFALRGSYAGSWDGTGVNMGPKRNQICKAWVLPVAEGTATDLGWGAIPTDVWRWPESSSTTWSWQLPSESAGDTLFVECSLVVLSLVPENYHGHSVLDPDLDVVCPSWDTTGDCWAGPDFRRSWPIQS